MVREVLLDIALRNRPELHPVCCRIVRVSSLGKLLDKATLVPEARPTSKALQPHYPCLRWSCVPAAERRVRGEVRGGAKEAHAHRRIVKVKNI